MCKKIKNLEESDEKILLESRQIEGSIFYRDHCYLCGEPIRVSSSDILDGCINYCSNCPGTVRNQIQAMSREDPRFKLGRQKTCS